MNLNQIINDFGGLLLLILFGVLAPVFLIMLRGGRFRPRFRTIPAFSLLRGQMGRAIESGRDLHVSIGTGSVSGDDTATTLAGLAIAEYLADEAAASGIAPTVTTPDPTSVLLAEDAVRRPYTRQGNLSDFPRDAARLPALNSAQYAAATMDFLNHEPVLTNVMSGTFGAEAALIDQAANNNDLPQLFGGSDPRALAVMSTSTDHVLMGEEMYAAKAYLRAPLPHLAGLRAADVVRVVIAVLIVIAFIVGLLSK
jgi:Domain of unknown function (DUF6754)